MNTENAEITQFEKGRLHPESVEEAIKRQGLVLAEGEIGIRYRDIARIYAAVKSLSNRELPTHEARLHAGRCSRVLLEHLDVLSDEKRRLESLFPAEDLDNETASAKTVELNRRIAALTAVVAPIRLPSPFTKAMLPEKSKDHPKNTEGLAAILADLGPLYEIELYPEEKKAAE